ncbi:glucose repression mediator protein [Nowakowskiella sp. JEL0078]|nr:glucose repression mediator protein [Nowakowskiella sp. JEL0078]
MDNLQKAYTAYQQALDKLPNAMEPGLWYGIGILYDKYGSFKVAEEAFAAVLKMDPNFEKANEIYYRLGFIYMQQGKYDLSLQCFEYIQNCPPKPLTKIDIWLKIGHVHEQQKDYLQARSDYEKVLKEIPNHPKGLQLLGWLYNIDGTSFQNSQAHPEDAYTYYQLGRCYMSQQKHKKAYEAYQKAVFRDDKDPRFWCSIGVLYFQIGQAKDALDAYIRAISFDSQISEVWFNLGTLYESCNNQVSDAIDAYTRALELDIGNPQIKSRLETLTRQQQQQQTQVRVKKCIGQIASLCVKSIGPFFVLLALSLISFVAYVFFTVNLPYYYHPDFHSKTQVSGAMEALFGAKSPAKIPTRDFMTVSLELFHIIFSVYLLFMISFHYSQAVIVDPGLPTKFLKKVMPEIVNTENDSLNSQPKIDEVDSSDSEDGHFETRVNLKELLSEPVYISEDGFTLIKKRCGKCNKPKPPRTHHCSVCNR